MHRLKGKWNSITTFNQFVASFVNLFHSKNVRSIEFWGTHLRRDAVKSQWFQASKAAAASDGHAVHC